MQRRDGYQRPSRRHAVYPHSHYKATAQGPGCLRLRFVQCETAD